jgi:uncharacterized protein
MNWNDVGLIVLQVIVLFTMVIGLLGLSLPGVPGLTIVWVAALVYGLIDGFNWASGILFAFITILMIFGNLVDNLFMGAGARVTGASWLAIGVAMVAGIAGTLLLPPIGGLIFALVGVFLVEIIRLKEWKKAIESVKGMALGCGWSFVARFVIGLMMIAWWLIWAFLLPVLLPS